MEYNVLVPAYTEFEKKLQNERDFFSYLKLLEEAKPNYLIIVAVNDTPAGPLFTSEMSKIMMKTLGLKIDMQNAFRKPYIAIIDCGDLLYEETSTDLKKSLTVNADLGNHELVVHSGGFACEDKHEPSCFVKLDDMCFYGGRGFNFYTINTEKGYIVDTYHCETYEILQPEVPLFKPFTYANGIATAIENNSCGGGGDFLFV